MENDAPPSYSLSSARITTSSSSSPPYSRSASTVIPNLRNEMPSNNQQWVYKADNIVADLGQNIWNTHFPCFGLNGVVEGSLRLLCPLEQVAKLCVVVSTSNGVSCVIKQRSLIFLLARRSNHSYIYRAGKHRRTYESSLNIVCYFRVDLLRGRLMQWRA